VLGGVIGADIETPKAMRREGCGEGCASPQPTRGSKGAS